MFKINPLSRNLNFIFTIKPVVFFLFLGLVAFEANGQKRAHPISINEEPLPIQIKTELNYTDSSSRGRIINRLSANLYDNGYLEAACVEIREDSAGCKLVYHVGPRYSWSNILLDSSLMELPNAAGLKTGLLIDKPISITKIANLNQRLLAYFENHGYPFATIQYTNFKFEGSKVEASLSVSKGELITMDSLLVVGDCKLSTIYLQNYLSLDVGDVYDERVIRRIQDRIRELPMVTEARSFSVGFSKDKCRVTLYLRNKRASQIDGVIGVQPPSANASGESKTKVTADVKVKLLSSFGRGELFDFNWKQPSPLTQDLKVKFNYPFLFNTPFGVDLGVAIFKKDTTYVDVILDGGFQFLLDGGNYLKVFVKDKSSSLVSTGRYKNATVLPPFADIRKTLYGAGIKKISVDYKLNPKRGYLVDLSISVGNRVVKKNSALPEALYDSVELKSLQFDTEIAAGSFFPLANRWVLAILGKGGWTQGGGLFENELYRFGGISSLRGFDEESLRASSYAIGTSELRFILDQNSYLTLFYDQGWYERQTGQNYLRDTPYGFGAGIAFDSKLGIFSINYALGSEQDNPILFKSAKVHFGVINYF